MKSLLRFNMLKVILNHLISLVAFLGFATFWYPISKYGFKNGGEFNDFLIVFGCYIFCAVSYQMSNEYLKRKYEEPNKTKQIVYSNIIYKKGKFDSRDHEPKIGIVVAILLGLGSIVPFFFMFIIWEVIPIIFKQ